MSNKDVYAEQQEGDPSHLRFLKTKQMELGAASMVEAYRDHGQLCHIAHSDEYGVVVLAVEKELMVFDGANTTDLYMLCTAENIKKPTKQITMPQPIVFLTIIDTMLIV